MPKHSTYALDTLVTFGTARRHVVLKAGFAVQLIAFLNKTAVHQVPATCGIRTHKMCWAPRLPYGRYKRTSEIRGEFCKQILLDDFMKW